LFQYFDKADFVNGCVLIFVSLPSQLISPHKSFRILGVCLPEGNFLGALSDRFKKELRRAEKKQKKFHDPSFQIELHKAVTPYFPISCSLLK
jgi:hypothetical protein